MDEFRSGKIYLKSLEWYQNSAMDNGQKDVLEGSEFAAYGDNIELYIGGVKIEQVANVHGGRDSYSRDTKASCFFLASEISKNKFQFHSSMRAFGEYIIMVTNNVKFLKLLNEYSKNHSDVNLQYNKCKYIAENEFQGSYSPFIKRDIYKNQNEWRLCITKHTDVDYEYIEVGDISDITIVLDADGLFEKDRTGIKEIEISNIESFI